MGDDSVRVAGQRVFAGGSVRGRVHPAHVSEAADEGAALHLETPETEVAEICVIRGIRVPGQIVGALIPGIGEHAQASDQREARRAEGVGLGWGDGADQYAGSLVGASIHGVVSQLGDQHQPS